MTDQQAEIDVETKSLAGNVWNPKREWWEPPKGASKRGISAVGAAAYAEHPSTDILTLTYRLPPAWLDAAGRWRAGGVEVRWRPGQPNPQDLFDYLAAGHPIEAHNAMFERLIWLFVLQRRYGWPALPFYQLRCSMAKANVNQFPAKLGPLADVLQVPVRKDKDGQRLINKFSVPQQPTKTRKKIWIEPEDDPPDFERLQEYCDDDVRAERGVSGSMEDLSADELEFWWIDQEINFRGLGVDRKGVEDCRVILEKVLDRYGSECTQITGGVEVTQLAQLQAWLRDRGVYMPSMDADHIADALTGTHRVLPHPPEGVNVCRRVLELRQLTGSASVKKLYQIINCVSSDDRLRGLLIHHGARTGRPTGEGAQPLNMPKAGPKLATCADCARPFKPSHTLCPWCASRTRVTTKSGEPLLRWVTEMVDHVLEVMALHDLALVEWFFGDAMLCISGCLRGLFRADPGNDLIASDYSAIEAVVMAMLSGEQWRIDAFRANAPIYLLSAAKITGRSLQFYLDYQAGQGEHHEDRQYIGKVAELALGFGGWIGAWRNMEEQQGIAISPYSDDEVKAKIVAWRDESPKVVEFWGGQYRRPPWARDRAQSKEYFGCEGAAIQAILNPGQAFSVGAIQFYMRGDALKVRLPSKRELTYQRPRLTPSPRRPDELAITYSTWNTNPKYGPKGWVIMSTYGPKLAENIVQAVAHDILRHAIRKLRAAGYHTVLHVYDEIVAEIQKGLGSLEEFERLMSEMADWCADWPVKAHGGWRGPRFRKAA